jgi:hypothetical protein
LNEVVLKFLVGESEMADLVLVYGVRDFLDLEAGEILFLVKLFFIVNDTPL